MAKTQGELEQDARIREALHDYEAQPWDYTFTDFEEIFEDRDPLRFLMTYLNGER